jgi:ABC-type branched-subunit amino acid transport system ATPase component/branched-subunit amino acid ABC-type transport system permease component
MFAVIIAGIVTGSVYGLVATGLVLTYRTSGIFNFAYGALGTVSAYVFYSAAQQWHLPLAVSLLLSVVVVVVALAFWLETLAARLAHASLALQIAATVGLLLIIEAVAELVYGVNPRPFPNFLPSGSVHFGGTEVTYGDITTLALSVIATVGLHLFLRRTRWGMAMRAVVVNPTLLAISGTEPRAVRRVAWVIGGFLGAISALLFAPGVGLDATVLTSLVTFGFGAAAIGGFASAPVAWLGGIALGIVQAVLTYEISSTSIIGNLAASLPFVVLFIVTLVYPRARLRIPTATAQIRGLSSAPSLRGWPRIAGALAVVALLAAVPAFAGADITAWTVTMATLILLMSLGLLVRTSGQISLCHVTFAAIGAVAFSKLTIGAGLPWLLALVVSGLIVVPIGIVLAFPAIRLSGLFLGLSTLGFGLTVQNMFYQSSLMFGIGGDGVALPAPTFWGLNGLDPNVLYLLTLVCTVIVAVFIMALEASRRGRILRALSDSPRGLESLGVSPSVTRVYVFALSAFLAGVAGALLGVTFTVVSGLSFDPNTSLLYLVLIVIVFGSSPWYALVAAVGVGVIPTYLTFGTLPYYLQIVFGASAILVAYGFEPHKSALAGRALSSLGRLRSARGGDGPDDAAATGPAAPVPAAVPGQRGGDQDRAPASSARAHAEANGGPHLQVESISVAYGGVTALSDVSLEVRGGRITGLIGPNGAGKTSLFNACSGIVRPLHGRVLLNGADLSGKSPSARARTGLGRTFQQVELFQSMTVFENVRLAGETHRMRPDSAGTPLRHPGRLQLVSRRQAGEAAGRALELCGVGGLAGRQVSELSTGQKRLVELARAVSAGFPLLLLDEPSAGLDGAETQALARIIVQLADSGTGILLVEHDVKLVMQVCAYIYVLDFGKLIFEGSAREVRESDAVRKAYLGGMAWAQ